MDSKTGIILAKDPTARQEEVEKYTEATVQVLAEELSRGFSDSYRKLLAYWSRLYKYSHRNAILLILQKPQAAYVASYKRWSDMGRQVAKGSKAAFVFAPVTKQEQDAVTGEMARKIVAFRLVPVFGDCDLENIESDPLPTLWATLPDDCTELYESFVRRIEEYGIKVEHKRLKTGLQGYSQGGKIVISTAIGDSRNRLWTAIHETGHEIQREMPDFQEKNEKLLEWEVESATYVIAKLLGFDHESASDYLLSHACTPEELLKSLQAIQWIVRKLVKLVGITERDEQSQAA